MRAVQETYRVKRWRRTDSYEENMIAANERSSHWLQGHLKLQGWSVENKLGQIYYRVDGRDSPVLRR